MTIASTPAFSRLRILVVAGLVVMVFVAMMLTSHAMAVLRIDIPRLSEAMSWLEVLDLPFDMDHVAFFSILTIAAQMLLPRLRWWWILLAVTLLAASTELIQFWVPGRTPKLLDARDDLIGGAVGLLVGGALLWISRSVLDGLRLILRRVRRPALKTVTDESPTCSTAAAVGMCTRQDPVSDG